MLFNDVPFYLKAHIFYRSSHVEDMPKLIPCEVTISLEDQERAESARRLQRLKAKCKPCYVLIRKKSPKADDILESHLRFSRDRESSPSTKREYSDELTENPAKRTKYSNSFTEDDNERPYKCSICSMDYTTLAAAARHINLKHDIENCKR